MASLRPRGHLTGATTGAQPAVARNPDAPAAGWDDYGENESHEKPPEIHSDGIRRGSNPQFISDPEFQNALREAEETRFKLGVGLCVVFLILVIGFFGTLYLT